MTSRQTEISFEEVERLFQEFALRVDGQYSIAYGLSYEQQRWMSSEFSKWLMNVLESCSPAESERTRAVDRKLKSEEFRTACVDCRYRDWLISLQFCFWMPHRGPNGSIPLKISCAIDPGSLRLFVARRDFLFQKSLSTEAISSKPIASWAKPFLPPCLEKYKESDISTYRIHFRQMELDRRFLSEVTEKEIGEKLLWDRQFQNYWLQIGDIRRLDVGRFPFTGGNSRCVEMYANIEPSLEPLVASLRLFERALDILFPPNQ